METSCQRNSNRIVERSRIWMIQMKTCRGALRDRVLIGVGHGVDKATSRINDWNASISKAVELI
jgi:hypothetical protein